MDDEQAFRTQGSGLKTAVLLGAGASKDAGIPITTEMTEKIYAVISSERFSDPDVRLKRAIGLVIGGLIFQKGIRSENPYEKLNVEEVFASVRMLANRNEIEAAPFIGSWHSAVEELDIEPLSRYQYDEFYRTIRNSIADELAKAVKNLGSYHGSKRIQNEYQKQSTSSRPKYEWDKWIGNFLGEAFKKIEKTRPTHQSALRIRRQVGGLIEGNSASGSGRVFRRLSDLMILSLKDMVWLPDTHNVSYLEPLLHIQSRPLSIYSLNYDNAVERLCQQHHVSYSVGITESGPVKFDPQARVHLMKLHGSIDWVASDPENDQGADFAEPSSRTDVRVATSEEMAGENSLQPAIIFGQGNKLTTDGPYLDLLSLFRNDLEKHDRLLVVGYSFRDTHVNHYIAQWFKGSPERHITVLSGENFLRDAEGIPFADNLIRQGGARIKVLEKYAAEGLPSAVLDKQQEG